MVGSGRKAEVFYNDVQGAISHASGYHNMAILAAVAAEAQLQII